MKITLNGYYGFANYGDELFVLTTILAARRWWGGHTVDILGPPVPGIEAEYRVPIWFPQGLYTSPGSFGKTSRLGFLAGAMLGSDLLVYAGGSTLSHGSIIKKIQRFAAERNITKFAAIGVSIGPFEDEEDEAEAARFLRKFTHISVRDRKSAELLMKMRLPSPPLLARDLVGALPLLLAQQDGKTPAAPSQERPTLGISICHFERLMGGDTPAEDRRNLALFEAVGRFLIRKSMALRIFCLNMHPRWGDEAFSRELEQQLIRQGIEVELICASDNLLGCWRGLRSCRAVVSIRLHGAITAYLGGVPFALVEYHRKCTDFLDDIGQPAALRIPADCQDSSVIERVIEHLFHCVDMPSTAPETYIAEAALNFTQVPWVTTTE